jgi:hypothetical protein
MRDPCIEHMAFAMGWEILWPLIRLGAPPDDIPESNASKSGRQWAIDHAKPDNLIVQQLAQPLGGYSGSHHGGHVEDDRGRDGAIALHRSLRRLHRDVPLPPRA